MFIKGDNSISHINNRYGHRCYVFHIEGIICYDPSRGKKQDPYWCVIEIDKEITRYYRAQFKKRFGYELLSPSFDAHVSVLKGINTPEIENNWKHLDGKKVTVWYDPNLYWNNKHVWLNTYCEEYFELRKFYNIENWNTKDFGHLTIGKIKE